MIRNRTVLLIESDDSSVLTLQAFLGRLPFFSSPIRCDTAADALNRLSQQAFDLVILDLNLPDLSGIDLLHGLHAPLPIIVTSTDPAFAVDCYDLNVSDYLVKPFTFQRFVRALNRALRVQYLPNGLTDNQAIYLKIGRSIQRFQYDEIDYIEAFGVYSKIWRNGKAIIVNEPISALENHLPNQRFLRIHKSYIISIAGLSSYSHSHVVAGGTKIPLGAAYRPNFEGFLTLLTSTSKID